MSRRQQRRGAVLAVIAFALSLAAPHVASAAPSSFASPITIAPGHEIDGVACPTASFCIAVGDGVATTSTDPAGGAGAWRVRPVDSVVALEDVSCASPTLCVAIDGSGFVLSSTHPAGGRGAWRAEPLDPVSRHCHSACAGPALTAIACPSANLCVATDDYGRVFATTRPTGPRSSWHRTKVASRLVSISCPSTRLCVAATGGRDVVVSSHPAGRRSWRTVKVARSRYSFYHAPLQLDSVSCPTTTLCLASLSDGFTVGLRYTSVPTSTAAWRIARSFSSPEPRTNLSGGSVSCGASGSCAAFTFDEFGDYAIYVSSSPNTAAWNPVTVPGTGSLPRLTALACTGSSLCVIVTADGRAIVGT